MSCFRILPLPDIGDYRDVPVVEVSVKAGDVIKIDDPIVTLETDKATMEVPSPLGGRILAVLVAVGDRVSTGSPIVEIEQEASTTADAGVDDAETVAAVSEKEPASRVPLEEAPAADKSHMATGMPAEETGLGFPSKAHASPSVRAYARELGVDIGLVTATGPRNRVLKADVQTFVKARLSPPDGSSPSIFPGLPAWPQIDYGKFGEIERQPLTRIQEITGSTLSRNYLTIPHVTNFDNADVTGLEEFRVALNAEKRKAAVRFTMVAFLIKASAIALKAYPRFNSSLDGKDLILKKYVNVGFAVDTPKGLLVPVIRDCDRKGIIEISQEITALAEKARQGNLAPEDMQGGCFSVSSLGGIGGAGFTPIIKAPEVAILGAARSSIQAVWNKTAFEPRLIMPLSLSWDHRVVDGVAAARFLGYIASLLGDFRRSIL